MDELIFEAASTKACVAIANDPIAGVVGPVALVDARARLDAHSSVKGCDLATGNLRTLLLVDDEDYVLASLRRLFRRDGYRILTANSGQEGLDLLACNEVDVIISDNRMPTMTGIEFLRKARLVRPETIRIVLSGYTELQSIADAINECAIFKFLTKPWDDAQLRVQVSDAFAVKADADEKMSRQRELVAMSIVQTEANARLEYLLAQRQAAPNRKAAK